MYECGFEAPSTVAGCPWQQALDRKEKTRSDVALEWNAPCHDANCPTCSIMTLLSSMRQQPSLKKVDWADLAEEELPSSDDDSDDDVAQVTSSSIVRLKSEEKKKERKKRG